MRKVGEEGHYKWHDEIAAELNGWKVLGKPNSVFKHTLLPTRAQLDHASSAATTVATYNPSTTCPNHV